MKTYNKPWNVMNKTRWRQKTGITDLTFGTRNVQTMLQPGKVMEIGDEVYTVDQRTEQGRMGQD
jgi:hypothetical protein